MSCTVTKRNPYAEVDYSPNLQTKLDRLHAASYGWALSCCGFDHDQAGDVLQSVYLKILEGKARFDGKASFRTWIFSVIHVTALEWRRKSFLRMLGLSRFERQPEAERFDPIQAVEIDDQQDAVQKALAKLPHRQSQVLHLVFYQDLTLEEAGAILGISIGSARTHYERGKKKLRSLLEISRNDQ